MPGALARQVSKAFAVVAVEATNFVVRMYFRVISHTQASVAHSSAAQPADAFIPVQCCQTILGSWSGLPKSESTCF